MGRTAQHLTAAMVALLLLPRDAASRFASATTPKALAEAYAGLGLRELADEHKRQANGSPEEKSASR